MNALDRAILDSIPVPANADGSLSRCCVIRHGGEWRTAWLVGTGKHAFGPAYPTVKAAIHASRYLNETRS